MIGETCLDVYVFGEVVRISPEAPVPVIKKKRKETKIGMAGNVCENLKSMLPQVKIEKISNNPKDIRKIRFIDEASSYQVLRYDIENKIKPVTLESIAIQKSYDAIVISDYNKGLLCEEFILKLIRYKNIC